MVSSHLFSLAWRGLLRELRSGSLATMLLALIVAVAAVTAVGFFVDRVDAAMRAQAAEFLAADARITAPTSLHPTRQQAQALGLTTADTLEFPTVLVAGERTQLVSLKAVGEGYPLRGSLTLKDAAGGLVSVQHPPPAGEIWLAERLMALLDLHIGDGVQLGQASFKVAAILQREPDVGNFFAQAAPRAMIALHDVTATGLVTAQSRVKHHLLLASDDAGKQAIAQLAGQLPAGLSMERPESSQPAFQAAFERAARFLGLAAVVAVLLAGAALLLAAQQYNRVQQDAAALMRAFGASRRTVFWLYTLRLSLLALMAAMPGVMLGAVAQSALAAMLQAALDFTLPPPGFMPVLLGLGVALLALLGFALPSLVRLQDTPPLRVLNQQLAAPPMAAGVLLFAGLAAFGVLVWLQARDGLLTLYMLGGLALSLALFMLLAAGLLWLLRRLPLRGMARFGLARLARSPWVGAGQIAALTLGLTVLLLLLVVRTDLLQTWREQAAADAPNVFAINIQPHEVEPLRLALQSVQAMDAGFFPMHAARLSAVNGVAFDYAKVEGRAKALIDRQLNLSVMPTTLPVDNRLLQGAWHMDPPGWSVEQEMLRLQGWKIGDVLTFSVEGQEVSAPITSVRKVNWDSMRPNFFIIGTPALLADMPAQYVTSFHLPEPNLAAQKALLAEFPTITLFDLSQILREVRSLIDRASHAVEFVFLFTLLAGAVVLLAAFHASEAQRVRETGLLRALGAPAAAIRRSLWTEYLMLGVLAGLLAATAAALLGALLGWKLFSLPWQFDGRLWGIGLLAGIGLAMLFVPLLARRVMRVTPQGALRG